MAREHHRRKNTPSHQTQGRNSTWIRSSTSHQMKIVATMKRKYAKANSLSLLLKIKKAEKSLNEEIIMHGKAWRAFFNLKRNISCYANLETKLNAYVGYVVPVISYASQVWYPSKTEMREIERVQQKATTWILNYSIGYKERLRTLKILPLSMYIELHDILFLQSVMDGKYSVSENSIPISLRESTTRQCSEFELNKNRIIKTDENFWTRAPKFFNILHKQFRDNPTKKQLTESYFNYFENSYNQLDTCTWRVLFSCGSCNPYQKLMPAEN